MEKYAISSFETLINERHHETVSFKFDKLLKANNFRKAKRISVTATAYVYSKTGDFITKAELVDASQNGIRFKNSEYIFRTQSNVIVAIVRGGFKFETILCEVRRMGKSNIQNCGFESGAEFIDADPSTKEKFNRFIG